MLAIKPGVNLDHLHPMLQAAMQAADAAAARAGVGTVWITSGADGTHRADSLHYPRNTPDNTCRALDFDIIDPDSTRKLAGMRDMLRARLPEFDILLEDPGGRNEHLHAEYQPKGV